MVGVIAGTAPDWIGDGDGYGYGDDSGYGYGSGYGSGYGDGYGYGSGYGYGDGSGSGYGYGYGYGSGYGDGYGYGDGKYWIACIARYALSWPAEARTALSVAIKAGATIAFWRSDEFGRACNGGRNNPVAPGTIETAPGPLRLRERGTLHATFAPQAWNGARLWVVAMHGEIARDGDKIGALKREIIGECLPP